MALSNITAGHIVAAMKSDIPPRNTNPLKNKVVHADIRVSGIDDDVGQLQEDNGSSVQLIERPSTEDAEDQERAEEMQTWWNNEMKKHMNQPDGYAKVAVLLIKWADELDELRTKKEVRCLLRTPEMTNVDVFLGRRIRRPLPRPLQLPNPNGRAQCSEEASASTEQPHQRLHPRPRRPS